MKQEKELSGTDFWSSGDIFLYSCKIEDSECDNETTEFSLMGESEINIIEVEVKRLTDKIRGQQDIFGQIKCSYREEVIRLKTQLEEGNKIRKQYKEKGDQCQRLQDELTSLRNQVNESDTSMRELKERTNYCESLEAKVVSLKEYLGKSNNQNE